MLIKCYEYESDRKVNFEYDGRELTANVGIKPIGEIPANAEDGADWQLGEVMDCTDSVTGEEVKVTEGVKAAIVLALRDQEGVIGEEEAGIPPGDRIFRARKK